MPRHIIDIENPLIGIPNYNFNFVNIPNPNLNCMSTDSEFGYFFDNYLLKNVPCLIKNVVVNWKCAQKWVKNENMINYDYLIENYGDLDVPVADCNAIEFNSQCKSNMKVYEYIDYLKTNSGSQLLYLKDCHLRRNMPDDMFYEIPLYFTLDWLNEYALDNNDDDFMFVYIGPKASWTPLHEDVYCSYSWSVNVIGKKKWILFPPGEEEKLKDSLGNLPLLFNRELNKDINHFEVIQEKGDAIFVPSGWHHQVINEEHTISINHNWINACNIEIVWKALQKSLLSVEHQIEEFKNTPEFSSQCQLILKSLFGMDVKSFITFICYIARKRVSQLNGEQLTRVGNYNLGKNILKFDLRSILRVMDSICAHHLFLNEDIMLSAVKDDVLELKTIISNIVI